MSNQALVYTIQQMQAQIQQIFEQVNVLLDMYGIRLYLYKIKTRSEACDTCVEYVWVFEFKDSNLYEQFVNAIRGSANE